MNILSTRNSIRVLARTDARIVVGVAQDVTETTLHDHALAAAARDLRLLVNKANALIFGIDNKGNVNIWNDKTVRLTGYSKEEALGKPVVDFLRSDVQTVFNEVLKGEEVANHKSRYTSRSGHVSILLINFSCRRDDNGAIIGGLAVSQDVTENALHDNGVVSMANELRQLIDTANAPIFGIDVRGTVNEWNNKTAQITGYSRDEAIGKPLVSTFIVKNLRDSVQRVMDQALQGNETSNYELEFRTKVSDLYAKIQNCTQLFMGLDGLYIVICQSFNHSMLNSVYQNSLLDYRLKSNEIRYLLVNATTRRDESTEIVGVVGVAQDVTETLKHDR